VGYAAVRAAAEMLVPRIRWAEAGSSMSGGCVNRDSLSNSFRGAVYMAEAVSPGAGDLRDPPRLLAQQLARTRPYRHETRQYAGTLSGPRLPKPRAQVRFLPGASAWSGGIQRSEGFSSVAAVLLSSARDRLKAPHRGVDWRATGPHRRSRERRVQFPTPARRAYSQDRLRLLVQKRTLATQDASLLPTSCSFCHRLPRERGAASLCGPAHAGWWRCSRVRHLQVEHCRRRLGIRRRTRIGRWTISSDLNSGWRLRRSSISVNRYAVRSRR